MKDNSIKIYKTKRLNQYKIYTASDWFKSGKDIIIQFCFDKILFKYPTLDYKGHTYRIVKHTPGKGNLKLINVVYELCPLVETEFDEEDSTEDVKVVYY